MHNFSSGLVQIARVRSVCERFGGGGGGLVGECEIWPKSLSLTPKECELRGLCVPLLGTSCAICTRPASDNIIVLSHAPIVYNRTRQS